MSKRAVGRTTPRNRVAKLILVGSSALLIGGVIYSRHALHRSAFTGKHELTVMRLFDGARTADVARLEGPGAGGSARRQPGTAAQELARVHPSPMGAETLAATAEHLRAARSNGARWMALDIMPPEYTVAQDGFIALRDVVGEGLKSGSVNFQTLISAANPRERAVLALVAGELGFAEGRTWLGQLTRSAARTGNGAAFQAGCYALGQLGGEASLGLLVPLLEGPLASGRDRHRLLATLSLFGEEGAAAILKAESEASLRERLRALQPGATDLVKAALDASAAATRPEFARAMARLKGSSFVEEQLLLSLPFEVEVALLHGLAANREPLSTRCRQWVNDRGPLLAINPACRILARDDREHAGKVMLSWRLRGLDVPLPLLINLELGEVAAVLSREAMADRDMHRQLLFAFSGKVSVHENYRPWLLAAALDSGDQEIRQILKLLQRCGDGIPSYVQQALIAGAEGQALQRVMIEVGIPDRATAARQALEFSQDPITDALALLALEDLGEASHVDARQTLHAILDEVESLDLAHLKGMTFGERMQLRRFMGEAATPADADRLRDLSRRFAPLIRQAGWASSMDAVLDQVNAKCGL